MHFWAFIPGKQKHMVTQKNSTHNLMADLVVIFPKLEPTQRSFTRRMVKQVMIHPTMEPNAVKKKKKKELSILPVTHVYKSLDCSVGEKKKSQVPKFIYDMTAFV